MQEFPARASAQSFSRPRSAKSVKDAVQRDDGEDSLPRRSYPWRQDSAIDLVNDQQRAESWKVDTVSLFSIHPDELQVDDRFAAQFDIPPGPRLSRPFMMPTITTRKRTSTAVSRRSVVSCEFIADYVKTRRITQDSDTLTPVMMSPNELQKHYADCIPLHPAFRNDSSGHATGDLAPIIFDVPQTFDWHSGPEFRLRNSNSERCVSVTEQNPRAHLQRKCTILDVDRERFAERLEASSKDLSKARAKLECAKQKLDVRERHIKDIVIQASVMKKVMEQTMQGYRDATRNLAELKDSQMANPANRPPFLSMRNRKLHNDFRAQKREVEKELSMTLQNLRSTEKKWKEAQALLNACTRDVDKQKCVVRDAAEDLRQAEAERSSVKEMLRKAEHELHSTREQLEDVRAPASSQNKPIALRRARTFDELAVANEKARRLEKRLSQVEAECEDTRSKLKTMKKRASLSPDTHLQKQLLIARRELKDREELLGMVKATNTELAEKIAQMELQLSGQITT